MANDVAKREPDLPWFQAVLVREPDNPYDPNAIAVYSPAGKIGHLSREDAEEYQDVLIAVENGGAHAGACSAFLRRANNGNWGSCWRCRRQISVLKRWRRKRARSFSLPRFVSRWLPWPLFPAFRNQFNPKDARFLGTPLDFIVFDGLDEGEVRKRQGAADRYSSDEVPSRRGASLWWSQGSRTLPIL